MFICVFMTYRFDVHDMFDRMSVMATTCEVNFLCNICMECFLPCVIHGS